MYDIDTALKEWKDTLCSSVDAGGLLSRNAIAHKWKAPFRCLSLRESVAWRTQDLLFQSRLLANENLLLGARILLRSAFETIAVLIYINQQMRGVVSGKTDFFQFSDKTTQLLLGSRNKSTPYNAMSILSILEKCDKRYPGIFGIYEGLCESAHPNCEGISAGYSQVDHDILVTKYSNRWAELFGGNHEQAISICIDTFYFEYTNEWIEAMTELESWIVENDEELEARKSEA